MISALHTSAASVRATPPPAIPARRSEGAPQGQTAPAARPAEPLNGIRRPLVSGGTLVAAQEAASVEKQAKPESPAVGNELSETEREEVRDLKMRDREVRAHEQAHASVGGQFAGSPSYELERGPDGQSYAVGGHVSISTSPVPNDPKATVDKMDTVKRAALAPADPSSQDRRVAADAEAKKTAARAELNTLKREEREAILSGDEGEAEGTVPGTGGASGDVDPTRRKGLKSFEAALGRIEGFIASDRAGIALQV